MARKGKVSRKTKETSISVELNIDGKGLYKIDTGIGFLDHMLEQLSKHSLIDLKVKAKGDTHIDLHHTTEDTGIAIGEALKKAAKKFVGIKRYAHRIIPMDETLTRVAIDVSNRPYLIWKVKLKVEKLGRGYSWLDTGTPQSLLQAATFVQTLQNRQGLSVCCPEEVALSKGFIDLAAFKQSAKNMATSDYGKLLSQIASEFDGKFKS